MLPTHPYYKQTTELPPKTKESESMPAFSASPGDYVEITLKGYVVYNTGGFIGITNDREVMEKNKKSVRVTFDREQGEYYFDIPEYMVTDEPKKAHEYAHGTIVRVTPKAGSGQVAGAAILEYRHDASSSTEWPCLPEGGTKTHWFDPNDGRPAIVTPDSVIEPLWDPEGNYR
jgi:hypothetical protein